MKQKFLSIVLTKGDLMAAAGISYTVGREGNDRYGETLNGVQIAASPEESIC
jgi:hypothetical protein